MPGVASILNKAVAGDARIHLYYNTEKSNLGLLLCDGTQEEADPNWELVAGTNHSENGIIPNQSSLSATFHRDVQLVFAITSKTIQAGGPDPKAHDVSIVSPVYKPLTSTDRKYFVLASTAVRTKFHVFFLGQNKDKLVIKNYTYPSGNSDLTRSTPAQDTDLAAYTVGTKSHVFYQEEDGTLNEYDVQKNISTKIDAATGVRKSSPLAAIYDDKTEKSYLYYVTSPNNALYRVTKGKDGAKWESPNNVEGAAAVNNKAQLTATLANGTNHLFYIEDKSEWSEGDKPVHVFDINV